MQAFNKMIKNHGKRIVINRNSCQFSLKFLFLFLLSTINNSMSIGKQRWYQRDQYNRNGSNYRNSSRIVGGQETTIDKFPYMVNLHRNGQFSCGGSLITARCVLTAAHCVYMIPVKDFVINAGVSFLNSPQPYVRKVERSFVSKFYSPYTLDMDVAILKLMEPIIPDSTVQIVNLCTHSPKPEELVSIVGWGVTSEGSSDPSEQIRTANIPVLSRQSCIKAYRGQAQITGSMFCATVPGTIDSCSGDSGGPVIYQGRVCGIVSWGFGCAREKYPGVYTNIANFRVNTFISTTLNRYCM